MTNIIERLAALRGQALAESNHVTAATAQEAIVEIEGLRASRDRWKAALLELAATNPPAMNIGIAAINPPEDTP